MGGIDGPKDAPSNRDATTHLKREIIRMRSELFFLVGSTAQVSGLTVILGASPAHLEISFFQEMKHDSEMSNQRTF